MDSMLTDNARLRYSQEPFPAYRYLPFTPGMPHPRRDPDGHSYAKGEDFLPGFEAADWRNCQPYLYGVDLFNHGYWWEAHEAWEAVWLAAGQKTVTGNFVQGLILVAAAQLKRFMGEARGVKLLTASGVKKLSVAEGIYLGIEISPLILAAERCLLEDRGEFPRIRLVYSSVEEVSYGKSDR